MFYYEKIVLHNISRERNHRSDLGARGRSITDEQGRWPPFPVIQSVEPGTSGSSEMSRHMTYPEGHVIRLMKFGDTGRIRTEFTRLVPDLD